MDKSETHLVIGIVLRTYLTLVISHFALMVYTQYTCVV